MELKHTNEELTRLVALPLDDKIQISIARIIEWYETWGGQVYVSYSGGKDSNVLLHLVRRVYPDIKACFINTGLEYPELQQLVRDTDNVDIIRPKMFFTDVITNYGYPLISKEVSQAIYYARRIVGGKSTSKKREELNGERVDVIGNYPQNEFNGTVSKSQFNKEKWLPLCKLPIPISHFCCNIMKKSPGKKYQHSEGKTPYLGTMAEESRMRKQVWLRHGCNAFNSDRPTSQPLSFWTEQDVLEYIKRYNIKIPSVYGDIIEDNGKLCTTGVSRTGCVFCLYGMHLEKGETRFQKLAKTHPRQYEYCLGGGQWIDNPSYDEFAPKFDGEWENWNPKKIIVPSKEGLGYKQIFDMVNEVYGKNFYRYD